MWEDAGGGVQDAGDREITIKIKIKTCAERIEA